MIHDHKFSVSPSQYSFTADIIQYAITPGNRLFHSKSLLQNFHHSYTEFSISLAIFSVRTANFGSAGYKKNEKEKRSRLFSVSAAYNVW